MGVVPIKKSLVQVDKLATAAFCRRRLAVVMVRLKMAETLREASTFIEQVGWMKVQGSFRMRTTLVDGGAGQRFLILMS